MIGNYNGVVEDDVMFRNGTVVTENVNDRLIHEVGQSCECVCVSCMCACMYVCAIFMFEHIII